MRLSCLKGGLMNKKWALAIGFFLVVWMSPMTAVGFTRAATTDSTILLTGHFRDHGYDRDRDRGHRGYDRDKDHKNGHHKDGRHDSGHHKDGHKGGHHR